MSSLGKFPARQIFIVVCSVLFLSCQDPPPPPHRSDGGFDQAAEGTDEILIAIAKRRSEEAPALGINLSPIFDWSRTPVFVDLVKHARRFGSPASPWDETALLSEDGWPRGDFGVFLASRQRGNSIFPGIYTVQFRGRGTVKPVASQAHVIGSIRDAANNLTTVRIEVAPESDQLALAITETGPGVEDLRVFRPGYDINAPPVFVREFLAQIAKFPVLRVMDWLRTNNNPVVSWEGRANPSRDHFATPKGVAWEDIAALVRVTGQDLWLNVPALADDDYIDQLARFLNRQLPTQTKVYVEYSNEVWNAQFEQHAQNQSLAGRASYRLPPGIEIAKPDVLALRRMIHRGVEISEAFRREFGDAAMMKRVRPVFASQVVNPWLSEQALKYVKQRFGPPHHYFYALAGAPYFNLGRQQTVEGLTVDEVLAAFSNSLDELNSINKLEQNVALARKYGLAFFAYEGGSDTFGPGSIAAKREASLDPRMAMLCQRYLDLWADLGGSLFMWFHAGADSWDTPYGTWELATDIRDTDSPKYQCLAKRLAKSAD